MEREGGKPLCWHAVMLLAPCQLLLHGKGLQVHLSSLCGCGFCCQKQCMLGVVVGLPGLDKHAQSCMGEAVIVDASLSCGVLVLWLAACIDHHITTRLLLLTFKGNLYPLIMNCFWCRRACDRMCALLLCVHLLWSEGCSHVVAVQFSTRLLSNSKSWLYFFRH